MPSRVHTPENWTSTVRYHTGFDLYSRYIDKKQKNIQVLEKFFHQLMTHIYNDRYISRPSTWVLLDLGSGHGEYGATVGKAITNVGGSECVQYIPADILPRYVQEAADHFPFYDVRRNDAGDINDHGVRERVFTDHYKGPDGGPDIVLLCDSGYYIKYSDNFFKDMDCFLKGNSFCLATHSAFTAKKIAAGAEKNGFVVKNVADQEIILNFPELIGIDTISDPTIRKATEQDFWTEMLNPVSLPDPPPDIHSPSNPYSKYPKFLQGRLVMDFLARGPLEIMSPELREELVNEYRKKLCNGYLIMTSCTDLLIPKEAATNQNFVATIEQTIKSLHSWRERTNKPTTGILSGSRSYHENGI